MNKLLFNLDFTLNVGLSRIISGYLGLFRAISDYFGYFGYFGIYTYRLSLLFKGIRSLKRYIGRGQR